MPASLATAVAAPARGAPRTGSPEPQHGRVVWVTGLTMRQAEGLLDWLEVNGCSSLEVSCHEGEGFGVRCACPPGWRLAQDQGGLRLLRDRTS